MFDEKISGWRSASSISSLRDSTTPAPPPGMSTLMTGLSSRSALKMGWGLRAISGSMPANGLSP